MSENVDREALLGKRYIDEADSGRQVMEVIGLDIGHPDWVAVSPVDGDRIWYRNGIGVAKLVAPYYRIMVDNEYIETWTPVSRAGEWFVSASYTLRKTCALRVRARNIAEFLDDLEHVYGYQMDLVTVEKVNYIGSGQLV